jgi:hypothetical protein
MGIADSDARTAPWAGDARQSSGAVLEGRRQIASAVPTVQLLQLPPRTDPPIDQWIRCGRTIGGRRTVIIKADHHTIPTRSTRDGRRLRRGTGVPQLRRKGPATPADAIPALGRVSTVDGDARVRSKAGNGGQSASRHWDQRPRASFTRARNPGPTAAVPALNHRRGAEPCTRAAGEPILRDSTDGEAVGRVDTR